MYVKDGTSELKRVLVSRPEYLKPAPINEIAKKWKDTTMDVEKMLQEVGIYKNWRGTNQMWRDALSWKGTARPLTGSVTGGAETS